MSEAEDPPWSVAWTGEQAFRVQPSADFPGKLELDQKQARGVGQPIFAAVHVTRQRRGMVDLLCHVCGEPTAPGDRYIFPTASGGLVTLHDGSQQYGCNVPPMHRACAERARAACPHLSRLAEKPLSCGDDEGRLIERTDVTPGLEAIAAQLPKDAPVVLSCYRLYGDALTRSVLEARAEWEAAARERRGMRP
ncbi:hypothetical protein [Phenylobacterium soli]|uniref:Uncharacterized protein n=1 Tax=Phenylobacterium soli TaxID=2170551 RepID=A0A328A909_9CAUL|nr:hypothetical protein [Phenylobacterium soli]RAK51122.1 hypothetical protein DJ017_19340 [Phenylobacterium soli]